MRKWLFAGAAAAVMAFTSVAPAQAEYMSEHRGGTMRLVARSAAGTIDPHINYTLQYWQLYQSIYDGLVNFKKSPGAEGFTKVPDLAEELPQATNDGKTYVFKIRKGIKFSNGQDLTTKDVVASFQRIFKVSSPTAGGFYAVIVGADKCLAEPKTCTLEGGVVADEAAGTVTINLTQPDAEFFDKLALPHAAILPADTPAEDVGSTPIPGTGAYMISAYDPNKGMTMTRNPHFKVWSEDAQPDGYPDVVQYDFGLTDEAEVTAVQNGEADWMFDQPPTDRLGEIGTKFKDQVFINTLTAWWYAPMNTRLAPFDNVKARQAVNYAIDRKALVNLFGGPVLASPVCQVLPPGFPGNEPYCPYTKDPGEKWSAPDVEKAKQLVEESGTKGQKVTVIVEDTAVSKSIGVYLQSVLKDIGYDADVKPISPNIQFTYIQNTNNKVQISVSQWYQDYPAASDFLYILFGCESFVEGSDSSINISGFCDEGVNKKMKDALALGVTDPDAANKMWAEIDKEVTDKAPMAALFTPKHIDFVSKRLGNFQFNSQFYWMVTQSWVQ
ncbi:MAG TPA: ABC transporter substrate-binding protein [Aestuariivirga sp.]|nr:ABC transporter substrate-binding protein [Alphaproteobacteria bacterium]HRX36768.1 ABC transporter substrate-binding protein [Aestuariivirga sp.]